MATESLSPLKSASSRTHLLIPVAVVISLFVMLVPMPPLFLDFFITINISISFLVLMVSMYIDKPVSFSVFPSLLLLLTFYRLALNLASTRLILLNGESGTSAAGQVIRSFGEFVVGGSFVVGLVIFIVLIVIQYVVINHGATRISEVTARFTLDALPGKQMAIDADLSAGSIDEEEAKRRRDGIAREAEFYGSMDGAIRFTQRDAVAGIIIIFVNIIAGLVIGIVQLNMPFVQALQTYTILTIGDGLVTAIPSLLISVTGAIITTRATARLPLGEEVTEQLVFDFRPFYIAGGILFALALVPGLPKLTFFVLSAGCVALGRVARRRTAQKAAAAEAAARKPELKPVEEQIDPLLKVDALALEIGYGLIPLVDRTQGGDLVDRIKNIRKQLALDMGVVVPPVHISDNLKLQPREYQVLIKDTPVETGELHPQFLMAINPGGVTTPLEGISTREPSYQLPAFWVRPEQREQAQLVGYTVVDAATVLSTHLAEILRRFSHELISRQEAMNLINRVAKDHPKVVEELIPALLSVGEIQKVLQNLLKERIPIRDMVTILETLADHARATRNVLELTEHVRQALRRVICGRLVDERGELRLFTLSPSLERIFQENIRPLGDTPVFLPDPDTARGVLEKFQENFGKSPEMMRSVVICASGIRPFVRAFLEQYFPLLTILSYGEIPPAVRVISLGMVN